MRLRHLLTPLALVALLLSSCNSGITLPNIALTAESEIVWEGWTPAQLVTGNDTLVVRTHYRGGISAGYPKHSLALKFDKRVSLCGLPADKDWILNANYIDKTFMRHKLSYDLFRQMNPDVNRAPLCAYVTLTLNGQEAGLYVLMQKLDASTLGIRKKDSSSVIFKEPPIFYQERIVPQKPDDYYQQTYPKKWKHDHTAQADKLRAFLFESPDSVFHDSVGQIFDLDNIIDWHLLLLFTNNADGMMKNFFLYKTDDSSPFRVAPWDYDHSYGRDGDNEPNMLTRTIDCNRSVLLRRLSEWESYRNRMAQRWQQLRSIGVLSEENFTRMVDHNRSQIADAVNNNEQLWPVNDSIYFDDNRFDDEVDIMLQFVRLNIARLDSLFAYNGK